MKQSVGFLRLALGIGLWFALGCKPAYDPMLPDSATLGNPRGKRIVRSIAHFHSPYSWDACDRDGLSGGRLNPSCLAHLRAALCMNRVDLLFLTDHPNAMHAYEMRELLLTSDQDHLVNQNGSPVVNQMSGCAGGFTPEILVGFESQLMALGMTAHLDPDPQVRKTLYDQDSLSLRTRLANEAHAVVMIPHIESRSVEAMEALAPDGVEIYNFHANVDPKIRVSSLQAPPFQNIPGFLSFLVDPYGELNPDFSFLNFIEVFPVYLKKWDTLLSHGLRVAGFGGSDSHENVFPQVAQDGERLDSHRRIMRFMSNHLWVSTKEADAIKQAMKAGQGWSVFEGLGSPLGMDFYATLADSSWVGAGESGSLAGGVARIRVKCPQLHPQSPRSGQSPRVRIVLKQIQPSGESVVVAQAQDQDLDWEASSAGVFRAELFIVPRHLKGFLGPFSGFSDQEFAWILTNPLYLES
ncbi:MAG: hypothetical protein ACO3A2_05785 [Bdellovibrionia bacterium]